MALVAKDKMLLEDFMLIVLVGFKNELLVRIGSRILH